MEKETNISLRDIADRVIKGEFGKGKEREIKLGYLYTLVQNIVNERYSNSFRYEISDDLIKDLAHKALNGVFGPPKNLKENLDFIYPKVFDKMKEIVKEELKNKKIDEIVEEVKLGKYGDGDFRKNILGELYNIVQKEVNDTLGNNKKDKLDEKSKEEIPKKKIVIEEFTIEQLAKKSIRGEFGNGTQRKEELGEIYPIVQNKVNEILGYEKRHDINGKCIEILADRTIKGEFGNGEDRKEELGELFPFVQNKVNEILGCNTVYEEKPIPSYIKV